MLTSKKPSKDEKHIPLKERLENYYKIKADDIKIVHNEETDWGKPEGKEVW